jgi:hypothetical protein
MLNIREDRDKMIHKIIESITEEFEYEPSEIITTLFESKKINPKEKQAFKDRKLKKKPIEFFSNSKNYIKRKNND